MSIKKDVSYYIWKARDEVGIDGDEDHDWWLAEKFLNDWNKETEFNYEDVYIWVMENA